MKRLILILVCALLMSMFIGFNYLLWDRENAQKDIQTLEYSNANNTASINALGREIKNLEDENERLMNRINDLTKENKMLLTANDSLEKEKARFDDIAAGKNTLINILKQQVDTTPMKEPVKEWVQSINTGQYEAAYKVQKNQGVTGEKELDAEEYEQNYKNSIKNIKIKTIELDVEGVPEDKKGDITFKVMLQVDMAEDGVDNISNLTRGENEKYFTVSYDVEGSRWIISDIE